LSSDLLGGKSSFAIKGSISAMSHSTEWFNPIKIKHY